LQFPAMSLQLLKETCIFAEVLYAVHTLRRHGSRCTPAELAEARLRHLAVRFRLRLESAPS
jgi:hypothetical protein